MTLDLSGEALVDGYLVYEKREDLYKAIKLLHEGGWIDAKGRWLSIDETREDRFAIDNEDTKLTLHVPFGQHIDLIPLLPQLKKGTNSESFLTWALRDKKQILIGGSIESDEVIYLIPWARKRGFKPEPEDLNSQERMDWEADVAVEFVFGPIPSVQIETLSEFPAGWVPLKYYH